MKIGVISDTHVPSNAAQKIPQKVLEAFRNVDMIIHAGDILDLAVIDALKNVCPNVKAVCGNMDSEEAKKILPQKEILKIGKYKIGIMHGYGHPNSLIELLEKEFKSDKVDVIVFGHSHNPFNEKKYDIIFFNPGSPTDKVFAPYNSYGIIEINGGIQTKIIKI